MRTKQFFLFLISLAFLFIGCDRKRDLGDDAPEPLQMHIPDNDALDELSAENRGDFKWMNPPSRFDFDNGEVTVVAEKETDFFNNPEDGKKTATAHYLYQDISGDFVSSALVRPDFSSQWNAISLMVHIDNDHWIKFAFENSDATGKSIVTVVTKELSDDANGVILEEHKAVWLKIAKRDNIYSMLWSADGKEYKMARLTTLPEADSVKIGVEFQCPVGNKAEHLLEYFKIEQKTVTELRKGV